MIVYDAPWNLKLKGLTFDTTQALKHALPCTADRIRIWIDDVMVGTSMVRTGPNRTLNRGFSTNPVRTSNRRNRYHDIPKAVMPRAKLAG